MSYNIVYSVLNDSIFAGRERGLLFLGFALLWTGFWFFFHKYVRGVPEDRKRGLWPGVAVGGILIVCGVLVVINETYPVIRDQRRCREWLRSGAHEVTEGVISQFRREAGSYTARTHFQIGDSKFSYRLYPPRAGGFDGNFTAAGTESLRLKNGMHVRIAHHDGRILQIEIAD